MKTNINYFEFIENLLTKPENIFNYLHSKSDISLKAKEKLVYFSKYFIRNFLNRKQYKKTICELNNQVLQYALHNYESSLQCEEADEYIDSLITSINMLGEELTYSTVTTHYIMDIFSSIPDLMFIVDGIGVIQSTNKTALDILKLENSDVLNTPVSKIFDGNLTYIQLIKKIESSKILYLKIANQKKVPVSIRMADFIRGGKREIGRVLIARDISETISYQKALEEQNDRIQKMNSDLLIALKKAEESDRLKTAFLANMSHEIRTPMNGIMGFAELLKSSNLSGEEQNEYIEIIQKSGNRMLNIINDIIDISKIEAGLVSMHIEKINLNDVIKDLYLFFLPDAVLKGLTLEYKSLVEYEDSIIITDKEKLIAILSNLIKNAIKFCDEGNIEFGFTKTQKNIEFFVNDTGIGIPKERHKAIFDRFVQADIEDRRAFQGAGLGLSITKAYVELLGGEIWLISEEGKGSSFYFSIPLLSDFSVSPILKVKQFIPEISCKKLKIIIAEDDEICTLLLTKMLTKFSKEILLAKNGKEAVELCEKNPDVDLIMMDIKMPVMDGNVAAAKIREFNVNAIIIAQTAFTLIGDEQRTIEAGCNEYLSKPVNKSDLYSLISKYFQ